MTKYPFAARINDEEVIVWPDWIERPEYGDDDRLTEPTGVTPKPRPKPEPHVPLFPLSRSRKAVKPGD